MRELHIDFADLTAFREYLILNERAENTIDKYCRDVRELVDYSGFVLTKDTLLNYKKHLQSRNLTPGSINTKISSINAFLNFKLRPDMKLKLLRIQRRAFCDPECELHISEYKILVRTAYASNKRRIGLVLELLAHTGMRVSEIQYVTVDSVKHSRVIINLKNKYREVLISRDLRKKLLAYIRDVKIQSGPVFITKNKTCLSRKQVWSELKSLACAAGILLSKVFPHNLRHLFAQVYYRLSSHDIVKLSSMLGHSSMDTTKIYLVSTGAEYFDLLNKLDMTLCL